MKKLTDSELQHERYFNQGFREHIIHQADKEVNDVDRYAPGSARRVSYDMGWQEAKKYLGKLMQTTLNQ